MKADGDGMAMSIYGLSTSPFGHISVTPPKPPRIRADLWERDEGGFRCKHCGTGWVEDGRCVNCARPKDHRCPRCVRLNPSW